MNVYVCFKVVSDLEKVIPSDWQNFDDTPDIRYVGTQINCLDESALESVLRLKDGKRETRCVAITLGYLPAILAKKVYAAGFDEVVCLECGEREFHPREVARRLVAYLKREKPDLVVTGKQAGLMDSGTVPIYIAEQLGLPILTEVISYQLEGEGLSVEHDTEYGICETKVALPLVLSMGNSEVGALRLATFRAQLEAGKKEVTRKKVEDIVAEAHELKPQIPQKCLFVDGSIKEKVMFLRKEIGRGGSV